ncbi:MAG TPA: YncE family protein [Candidatus Sulfopaludibacter sp.]|jgi:DNA-binding beta-propeller fold protein YncE|nr:YncE family protein [Candidatus Sulfopaludibacter sp.]
MKKFLTIALVVASAFAAEGYKVLTKIKIGGEGRWDYIAIDSAARRLYVSHASSVEVIDPDSGKIVGTISGLHGVHGIAIAPDLGKGYITNGQSSSVTIFDLKTLAKSGEPTAGKNPDAVCYESKTKRVFAINHSGNDATAIDAKTGEVLKSFPIGTGGEFCQSDGAGKLYVNIEPSNEVVEIDAAKMEVTRRASILPCEGPSGLAIDVKDKKLFSVCDKVMAVTDIPSFKVVATPAIGNGPDAAGFDPGTGLAFSSNGDGTLSIIKQVNGKYETVDTVTTERGARTMTVDPQTHKVFLLAAEYGPAAPAKDGKKGRATVLPDSFHVLVVGK